MSRLAMPERLDFHAYDFTTWTMYDLTLRGMTFHGGLCMHFNLMRASANNDFLASSDANANRSNVPPLLVKTGSFNPSPFLQVDGQLYSSFSMFSSKYPYSFSISRLDTSISMAI